MSQARKGARRAADIPPEVLDSLNRGEAEALTLVENLATDFALLLSHVMPELAERTATQIDSTAGVTKRMVQAADCVLQAKGAAAIEELASHRADLVRGWAAYMTAALPDLTLADRLQQLRRFAADEHFGVREWAWLAVRPAIVADPIAALETLTPWTHDKDANVRRFASEATRPRGVWCSHIAEFKQSPELARELLDKLREDPSRYVQDSVSNWLNDAGKTQPDFVRDCCADWQAASDSKATAYIVKRATRNL